jgi:hypothetical protein
MDNDTIDTPLIDPNLDSYKHFFDHKWSECMYKAVESSPLNDAVCTRMVACALRSDTPA